MPKEKSMVKVLVNYLDTGCGADPENELTKEMVTAFADCDLIITAVVDALVNETGYEDGFWQSYGYGEVSRPTELGEGRERLAKMFGKAYDRDLEQRYEVNQRATAKAGQAADEAKAELFKANRLIEELRGRVKELEGYRMAGLVA